jgi:hypothetical protein
LIILGVFCQHVLRTTTKCMHGHVHAKEYVAAPGLANIRSTWCAPFGMTTATIVSDTFCKMPPPCHGSMRPLDRTMLDAPSMRLPPRPTYD